MMERWFPRAMRRPIELEEAESDFPFRTMWWRRTPEEGISWAPAVDVYDKDDEFIVRAELPGVKMDDVEISMSGDTLTIQGERKQPENIKAEEFECCEVCYGPFSRSITLNEAIERDNIEATFDNGILEIHLPKAPEARTAKIEVKAKQTS